MFTTPYFQDINEKHSLSHRQKSPIVLKGLWLKHLGQNQGSQAREQQMTLQRGDQPCISYEACDLWGHIVGSCHILSPQTHVQAEGASWEKQRPCLLSLGPYASCFAETSALGREGEKKERGWELSLNNVLRPFFQYFSHLL